MGSLSLAEILSQPQLLSWQFFWVTSEPTSRILILTNNVIYLSRAWARSYAALIAHPKAQLLLTMSFISVELELGAMLHWLHTPSTVTTNHVIYLILSRAWARSYAALIAHPKAQLLLTMSFISFSVKLELGAMLHWLHTPRHSYY